MKNVAVVGAGASGIVAAITSARLLGDKAEVCLFERNERVGKKILSTGNGRCNLSNENIDSGNFLNESDFAINAIKSFDTRRTLEFFESIGLFCKTSPGGRIFPYHENAASVVDVLRNEIERLKINVIADTYITQAVKTGDGFKLFADSNDSFVCDRLIISTGGKAAPKTGSDGNGFNLLASFGHKINKITPALAQIKTDNSFTKPLKGIKICVGLTVTKGDKCLARSIGEVIFTDYGLSGTAAFDISAIALSNDGVTVNMDFLPEFTKKEVTEILAIRAKTLGHLPLGDFFTGLFNKRVGQALCKKMGMDDFSYPCSALCTKDFEKLSSMIKCLEFNVKGHTGWDFAQTSLGGVCADEFDNKTMESKLVTGLYASGELFGTAGNCGGYNLQWAWTSGFLSGEAASNSVKSII